MTGMVDISFRFGRILEVGPSLRKKFFSQGEPEVYAYNMKIPPKKIVITEAENALWYPLRTVPRHEMKLYCLLEEKRIPAYLPVMPSIKVHHVHYKSNSYRYENEVLRPMLPSYVFARLDSIQRQSIWRNNSVRAILDVPKIHQESFIEELRGLQVMEELSLHTKVEYKREIAVNDRFVIEEPPQFEGAYGYLVERRKRFLWVIKLEIVGGYVTAEIDPRQYKFTKI